MSYIDALYKKDEDKVYVVERNAKGERIFVDYDARYTFYYPDARGKHKSITGETFVSVVDMSNLTCNDRSPAPPPVIVVAFSSVSITFVLSV